MPLSLQTIRLPAAGMLFLMLACLGNPSAWGQSSVLATGKWYKVAVSKDGVYKINRSLFKKMGFDPGKTDPRNIRIYGNGGGMLPQSNAQSRPTDLIENAIVVQGESDGVFHEDDYILFYAEGADRVAFDAGKGIFRYEKNLYATQNFYFITVSDAPGKRVDSRASLGTGFPVVTTYENFSYHELDQFNILKSGREWFGEKFDLATESTLTFDLPNVAPNSTLKLVSDVMAQSVANTSFTLFLNGIEVATQNVAAIPNTQYGIKGRHKRDTLSISANTVGASGKSSQQLRYRYTKNPSVRSIGYLDFALLQATQQLLLTGNQTRFRSLASLQQSTSQFEVSNSTSNAVVWDVTNPLEPIAQESTFNTGLTIFSTSTTSLREFIIFNTSVPSPELAGVVANQDLHALSTTELIIITHPDFLSAANQLAAHRAGFNGVSTTVVTSTQVYNEYSSGKPDVSALRDFTKSLYDKSPAQLKSLLLMGKGSYDYKDLLVDNRNFLLTYESRNSLHPLQTYSSDDFFGFLENTEGEWEESPPANHSMDIGVGRLPVKSAAEASQVVTKLIQYDTQADLFGPWRKKIFFVADDGDFNIHQSQSDILAEEIENNHSAFDVVRTFLDNYAQPSGASGKTSPATRKAIEQIFYDGALVMNYTGHGSERVWAQERIFDDLVITSLTNPRWPLMITATCEFGRQDDPVFISSGELLMLQKNGGAIGLVTTARPVNSSTNFDLNEAFYDAFFQQENNAYLSVGEIFRRTKNNSQTGVANRNFSLIGDPSLRLAMPPLEITVDQLQTSSGSDTLKALSDVVMQGRVTSLNQTVSDFQGQAHLTLYDKKTNFETLGDENSPFVYTEWYNALFRGQATVTDGEFHLGFVMPKNIDYAVGPGKLSAYASDTDNHRDASGFFSSVRIGLSEPDAEADTTPPEIELFMNDTTFVSGGSVPKNSKVVARLSDDNGINISGYGIGNSILIALDDTETFTANAYYVADPDNAKSGTLEFPLNDIPEGKHTLTLKAWDVHNNPAQMTIAFEVSGENISIEQFYNYPNPVMESTHFVFRHNRAGDDLEGEIHILDATGRHISSLTFDAPASTFEVTVDAETLAGTGQKNLPAGIYLARLILRSVSNGSKNEHVTKLFVTN